MYGSGASISQEVNIKAISKLSPLINIFSIKWFLRTVGALLLFVLLEGAARGLETSLPEALFALKEMWTINEPGRNPLYVDMLYTLYRFIVGYTLAFISGITVGMLVARIPKIGRLLSIPIEVLRPIPAAVIIPLSLVVFGISDFMKIFVVWYGAMWPILIMTRNACQSIDRPLIDAAKSFHVEGWQQIREVVLRAALPHIMGAARTALAIALLLTITVEMIAGGAPNGLGYAIIDSERAFRYDQMIMGTLILMIIGYSLNGIFMLAHNLFMRRRYAYLIQTPESD